MYEQSNVERHSVNMADFTEQIKILEELERARKAVKRKYNLIKFQKDTTDEALKEAFKLITQPLHKLAESSSKRPKKIRKSDYESTVESSDHTSNLEGHGFDFEESSQEQI